VRSDLPARDVDRVVIDGSVALKAALVEDGFGAWVGVRLHAPTLIWSEVASGASQLRWRGEISARQAQAALEQLLRTTIETLPSRELAVDAVRLAQKFGWAKTYDAEYVALAMRLAIPLLTSDARLAARVRGEIDVLTPVELDDAVQA
jgi:predicted nucleic acid-binding protein